LAFVYNPDPATKTIVDHINTRKQDDRAINLRWATPSENSWNQKKKSNNTSGYKGVSYRPKLDKYTSAICVKYKTTHLGTFKTAEEAYKAYCDNAKRLFGEFACFE
jgi:hypothetical protein